MSKMSLTKYRLKWKGSNYSMQVIKSKLKIKGT
jgi:hypothetical protein